MLRNGTIGVPLASTAWYDISTRATVRDSWNLIFWPTSSVPTGWNGDVALNVPGTTTQAFQDAVATRINWFRAMAGVPPQITLDPTFSAKDQKAALMFSANRQISHYPPNTWLDYSADGAEAASKSNICYGYTNDPGCLMAYMSDWGPNNGEVGHRRWILYPQSLTMGTGDVPQSGAAAYPPANALWVIDGMYGTTRPATRTPYVAWPPPGFVPYQTVSQRWSFSFPGADFSSATVSMQRNGAAVPVRLETGATGYGENTIVWVPDNLDASTYYQPPAPASDTTSTVTVSNVGINGSPQSFTYSVTIFDPATVPGSSFQFQPSSASISSAATSGSTSLVVSPAGTSWTAASGASWLTLTSPSSGSGTSSINWSADANPSSYSRMASILAQTAVFAVTQAGTPCSFAFSSHSGSLPTAGGSGSFTVTATPTDCAFGSYSYSGAISVSSSASNGVLTLNYSAGVNNTGSARSSSIQVAGGTFSITQGGPLTSQTITFGTLGNRVLGTAPFSVSATASSGLAVSFNSQTTAVCTVSGTTVTLVAVGACTVQATQAGNISYSAAPAVNRTFQVTQGSQTITFAALANRNIGSFPATLTANASSGLAVSFTSQTLPVCTVSGSAVTLVALGTCTVQATQAGNANFTPAPAVARSFQVTPNLCDLNSDGTSNVSDVQRIINEALGVMPLAHDLNKDGAVNVSDVQIVINSSLGMVCTAL